MKRAITLLLLLALSLCAFARDGKGRISSKLSYGLEWGYSLNFYTFHHYNIISDEGYRIDRVESEADFHSGLGAMASLGYDISKLVNISLLVGYEGIDKDCRIIPVLLRAQCLNGKKSDKDCFFSLIEGGVGPNVRMRSSSDFAYIAGIGEGYRFKLSQTVNLDLMLRIRCIFYSPLLPNPLSSGVVSSENIRRNQARFYSAALSLGVNF